MLSHIPHRSFFSILYCLTLSAPDYVKCPALKGNEPLYVRRQNRLGRLVVVPDGKHDIASNKTDLLVTEVVRFLNEAVAKRANAVLKQTHSDSHDSTVGTGDGGSSRRSSHDDSEMGLETEARRAGAGGSDAADFFAPSSPGSPCTSPAASTFASDGRSGATGSIARATKRQRR